MQSASLERAQQVIGDDAPIAGFSSFFLAMMLDAIRGAHLNSSVTSEKATSHMIDETAVFDYFQAGR